MIKNTKENMQWFIALLLMLAIGVLIVVFFRESGAPPAQSSDQEVSTNATVLGIYKGELPCADCSKLTETLTLVQKDSTTAEGWYVLTDAYEGKGSFTTFGEWTTLRGDAADADATIYELNPDQETGKQMYYLKISENQIQMLSSDLKTIESPYNKNLTKQ